MTFQLQSLLDLRRDAEKNARQTLAFTRSLREREEDEQARFVGRWREASARLAVERDRLLAGPAPTTAAQATARELYLGRLSEEASRLAVVAEEHRTTALARATEAEHAAQLAHQEARKELQAIEKLKERALEEDIRMAVRQAEDEAGDLAQAAFIRSRTD